MANTLPIPNILVVDDDPADRDVLTIILRPFGAISKVASAEDAFAVVKERSIDLVTFGVNLSDRFGLDVLQEIKRLSPNVDMILITARGTLTSALRGLNHGAAGFLIKPFDVMELVRLVVRITQKKRALASA